MVQSVETGVKKSSKDQKKIRVLVLFGGRSGEHDISLRSAASVVRHLDTHRFEVIPVAINRQGRWLLQNIPASFGESLVIDEEAPRVALSGKELVFVSEKKAKPGLELDVVFPVMHGPLCEDGAMQGLFEVSELPYVGSGVLASAVAMDKDLTKRLALQADIPIVPYVCLTRTQWEDRMHAQSALQALSLPVFVKPANMGSSVGVHKVQKVADLEAAILDAFKYDYKVVIEKGIPVREIELAVLDSLDSREPPLVSLPGEIISSHDFYSYEAKYLDPNGARPVIPAELDAQSMQQAQELALKAYQTLGCEGFARVDLFLHKTSGKFYFNEINTLPGFTSISMYPKMIMNAGVTYPDLLTRLIELAMNRGRRSAALSRG